MFDRSQDVRNDLRLLVGLENLQNVTFKLPVSFQKQPSGGVLSKGVLKICGKCDFNKVAKQFY